MEDSFYKDLGFRLRHARTMQKLSQRELGEMIGRGKQTVQRYEDASGQISADTVLKCAKSLNTSVSYLYGEENTGPQNNFSRQGLLVTSEIMALPNNNLRKSIYHLVREINEVCNNQDNSPE